MSLLSIVQQHCRVNGLPVPGYVISSADSTIQQYLGILNELIESMIDESKFQAFTEEGTWTYIAGEDQGDIYTIAPNGLLWFFNETFYDRTLRRPVYGPISDTDWQALKAIPNPGPFYKYRIRGNRLLINPAPTAPLSTIAFEYASSYGVIAADGVIKKPAFTADDDTFRLPERILQRGLKYRWKQEKGLPYQSDETAYYSMLNNAIARDKTKARHNIGRSEPTDIRPGIFVPSGNWNV